MAARKMSPIEITEVNLGATVLRPRRRVVATVRANNARPPLYVGRVFGRFALAESEADLLRELADLIGVLWRAYAAAPNSALSADAIALAEQVRAAFEEVPHG